MSKNNKPEDFLLPTRNSIDNINDILDNENDVKTVHPYQIDNRKKNCEC